MDGHRPALPQPLPVRRAVAAAAVPRPLVQARHGQEGRHPRRAGRRDRRTGRRAAGDGRAVQRLRARPASTRTSTAARAPTTSTTPTRRVKPNPSLHAIDKGPFYAVKIVPGDLGTKGGLVTDERARVLRPDGSVIPGLYAAGQRLGRRHGPHLRRPRRHHRPGPGVRLPRRRGHRAAVEVRASAECPSTRPSRSARSSPDRRSPGPRRDVLLYHLAIGATDLSYTLERPPACRCCRRSASSRRRSTRPTRRRSTCPGCDINLAQVVHGVAVDRGRRPAARRRASATLTTRITDVWDKGKAAVIWQEGVATRAVRRGAVDRPVVDLRPRRGRLGRRPRLVGRRSSSPTARPTPTRRTT